MMLSLLKTFWRVFLHMFHKRETVQYPEQPLYLPPRYRGRIILSRDPDGGERCVACYLCAVVCPVACIALHFLRLLRGRLPNLRHSAYPRSPDVRIPAAQPGL